MSKQRPPLAKSELEVARVVWELGEASVRQVLETLPRGRILDFWTVQTYLRRLKQKGYLKARRVGNVNLYSSAMQPKRVIREMVDDFLHRLFDGEVLPFFQHLVEARGLTEEEIEELQDKLNELKAERK